MARPRRYHQEVPAKKIQVAPIMEYFHPRNVSWKGNGKVGQQDECEQYSQELKAGYQNSDIARQTGQKVN
jgi:hypothetical protein